MHTFSTVALLASVVAAVPLAVLPSTLNKRACPGPEVTIYLDNRDAHTSAQATLCTDNLADDVQAVFAYTDIDSRNGQFYVTSARLVSYTDGVPAVCNFQNNDNGDLYGRVTKTSPVLNTWVTTQQPGLIDLGRSRIQFWVDPEIKEEYYKCLGISSDAYTACINKVTAALAESVSSPANCA